VVGILVAALLNHFASELDVVKTTRAQQTLDKNLRKESEPCGDPWCTSLNSISAVHGCNNIFIQVCGLRKKHLSEMNQYYLSEPLNKSLECKQTIKE